MIDMRAGTTSGLAQAIVSTCGPRRILHVGATGGALLAALLERGADAHAHTLAADQAAEGNRCWPGRFLTGPLSGLASGGHSTVVADTWLDALADDGVDAALAELRRLASRFVWLVVGTTSPTGGTPTRDRDWWEARCFTNGLRRHPAHYRLFPHGHITAPGDRLMILLECCATAKLGERSHHDALREQGASAHALCVRYQLASTLIRPGDTVLDIGCSGGAGSHLLHQNSLASTVAGTDLDAANLDQARDHYGARDVTFRQDDPEVLASIADHSVDFAVSHRTASTPPALDAHLAKLRRGLRPAGRVLVVCPAGSHPDAAWTTLRTSVARHFLLEKGFVQAAGGEWFEVPLTPLTKAADWLLVLAMVNPVPATDVPYRETSWALPDDPDFHFLAFGRDYRNPWLAKAMVTIGMRFEEPTGLRAMHEQVLREAPPDSVDHGAALCGQAYTALAAAPLEPARFAQLLTAIRAYAALPAAPPHRLRWQISLLFVGGELARQRGETGLARELFEDCASRDACRFSPLLGNKTLEALFRLATMDVAAADLPRARERLQRTVVEARRMVSGSWLNVCGDLARPIPAGLAELAQLLDKASRAAYALVVLESALQRPAMFAWEARGWFERILDFKNSDLADLRRGHAALRDEVLRLDAITRQLAAEVVAKEARLQELAAEIVRKEHQPQDLTRQPGGGSLGFVRRCLQFLFGKRA